MHCDPRSCTFLSRVGFRSFCWFLLSLGLQTGVVQAGGSPIPSTGLQVPGHALVGERTIFQLTFRNSAGEPGLIGYGPFIDLTLPATGADGSGEEEDDGLTFLSASYLGISLVAHVFTFPEVEGGLGCLLHPLARDPQGVALEVCGPSGDQLVTLVLPFGSFVPSQPELQIDLSARLSPLADLSVPLGIHTRGGFRFGADPLDNPSEDPALLENSATDSSSWTSTEIRASVATVDLRYLGPEDETATGPSFPQRYEVVLDVADGQVVDDVGLSLHLAKELAFLQVVSTSADGVVVRTPPVGQPALAPSNEVRVDFASLVGGPTGRDATVVVEMFAPRLDALGAEILDPLTGGFRAATSAPTAVGSWLPADPRDPESPGNLDLGGLDGAHVLSLQSLAVQKSFAVLDADGASRLSPGDRLQYVLDLQISDYFAFGGLTLQDVLSDGQRLLEDDLSVEIHRHGESRAGALSASRFGVTVDTSPSPPPNDGRSTLMVDLAGAFHDLGLEGSLAGGCVPLDGTGGGAPDCGAFSGGPTTGALRFETEVQQAYSDDFPSGDASVDEGDRLSASVDLSGQVLQIGSLLPPTQTGFVAVDDSASATSLGVGDLTTSVYAINGTLAEEGIREVKPGDEVTFRFRHTLPTANFETLEIVDYLPLPVFEATEVSTFRDLRSASPPPAGEAWLGPAGTFRERSGRAPALSTQDAANTLTFDWGTYDDLVDSPSLIDVLLTATVTSRPFADDLLLTQQVHASQQTTQLGQKEREALVQVRLRQPELHLSTGVVATDASTFTFDPAETGPVDFSIPGVAEAPFSGILTSDALAAQPIHSDLTGPDAGDLVVVAVAVVNRGGSAAYDLVLRGDLPPGFVVPAGGPRLHVRRGDGLDLETAPVDPGTGDVSFFAQGLEILDPPGAPALASAAADGSDLLLLTYVLEVASTAEPGSVSDHRVEMVSYGGVEGTGATDNHVELRGQIEDSATVTALLPQLRLDILESSAPHTPDVESGRPLAVGERIRLRARVTIPEGRSSNTVLELGWSGETAAFRYESVDSVSAPAGLTSSAPGGIAAAAASATIEGGGSSVRLALEELINADRDDSVPEILDVELTAVVVGVQGQSQSARASWQWEEGSVAATAPPAGIVEPALTLQKTASTSAGDGGDRILYSLEVAHAAASATDAFDLVITDPLEAEALHLEPGTVSVFASFAVDATIEIGGGANDDQVRVSIEKLPLGEQLTVEFEASVRADVASGSELLNRAQLSWQSLPGSDPAERAYGPLSAEHRFDVAPVTVTKRVLSSSDSATGAAEHDPAIPDLTPGELVTYELEVTVPEGTASSLEVRDQLPVAPGLLELISVEGPFLGTGSSLSFAFPSPVPTIGDELPLGSPDGRDDQVSWFFGTVTNPPDGVETDADRFTLRVHARLSDVPANTSSQDDVPNAVAVSYGGSLLAAGSASIEVVEPELHLSATATPAQGEAGDAIDFVLTLGHTGESTSTAFDLELRQVLNSEWFDYAPDLGPLEVVPAGLGCPQPEIDDSQPSGEGFLLRLPALEEGEICQMRFTARLAQTVRLGSTVSVDPQVIWDNRETDSIGDGTVQRSGSDQATAQVAVTSPSMTKAVQATSLASTGASQQAPELQDATIGELVTYRFEIVFPDGALDGATWSDGLP
ncbi:MAG: hypothetical protein MI919_21795, partial [Holophagales bacterium]|nr:hypothetical protein [Holophagales bacterium]